MNLSKSKYCSGIECIKKLWLETYKSELKEELDNNTVLENGTKVGEVAKDLFGKHINIEFNDDLSIMIKDTKEALKNKNVVITEASFEYDSNFCSVDILVKKDNNFEIYEVKSSTEVKDIYREDLAYQVYVLTKLGLNITKACVTYINSSYVRNGNLELNKLFIMEDLTDYSKNKLNEIEKNIKIIKENLSKEEPDIKVGIQCFKPYECPFFNYCSKHLPKNNIFNIKGMKITDKIKFYENDIYKYEDLLKENINEKYKEQIEYELYNKEDKIEKENIKEFMKQFTYPLYFLDFETYQTAIPLYDGIRPYMQIPFQYSLHIMESENSLEHKEFLSEDSIDPRRSLALNLVKDIPKDVCVIAYNMKFEKMVIKDLANLYPDLKDHLMNIHDNMKDLMIPFSNRWYYKKDLEGSFSIKYVLPSLFPNDPSLDYHNLEGVHKGTEASLSFETLGNYSKEEKEIIRKNLLLYCKLDTYAMVKIYERLRKIK